MAFRQYGAGSPKYLLLHGIPGSSHSWEAVAKSLANDGATVYVPDLLGFGASTRPVDISGLWVDAQVDALKAGLKQFGVDTFHLVGHDYGGPVAITLHNAIAQQIQSLTLLATNTFTDTPIPPPLALIRAPGIGRVWAKLMFSRLSLLMMLKQGVGMRGSPVNCKLALGDCSQTQSIATIFEFALRELETRYRAVEDSLPKIKVPTQVIWGTKDPFFSVRQGQRTASAIPNAKFTLLEGAGHFLPEERPDEVTQMLAFPKVSP